MVGSEHIPVCSVPAIKAKCSIYFHFRWDHWAHCGIFEDGVLLMYMLEGINSVANFITAYKESQYNRDFHFLSVI